jgi:hypothetical protein
MVIGSGDILSEELLTKEWYTFKAVIENKLQSDNIFSIHNDKEKDIITSMELSRVLVSIHNWKWRPPL